mmetsp:Transcript_37470/g.79042  ORF Transcript_37470/g.79042 Transcript_37470/m.79042 type:complete len:325 (-) Transcript_37470:243-1217(-)
MTTSSQYLTLEEFNSSSSPLPSIIVPRPQALRFVELCELAEMSSSTSGFLDFIRGGSSTAAAASENDIDGATASTTANANGNGVNPHVLVTQMAILLYLGEYSHARHLWRRQRRAPPPPPESSNDDNMPGNNNADYVQMERLWNAAKYIYLWDNGGIHAFTTSARLSSLDGGSGNNSMQVEETTSTNSTDSDNNADVNLPFSTLALRALGACQSSGMEPLATYAGELTGTFRTRVNRRLHRSFDKLACEEFCLRMNLTGDSKNNNNGDGEIWEEFGWKKEGGYLISDVDVVSEDDDDEVVDEKEEDHIGKLTDIVMFLEGKMNA